jgi:hypothetical protein
VSRLPVFFALLAAGGGALVTAATLLQPLRPEPADAAPPTPLSPLVASPVPRLAPQAVPAPDRIRVPPPPAASAEAEEADAIHEAAAAEERRLAERRGLEEAIAWRSSRALGVHWGGSLQDGVLLPHEGRHFFTWDPVRWAVPAPEDRRWGTDRLVRTILEVAKAYAEANPGAPRIAVGDLSRPGGGSFDARYGVVGEFGAGRGTSGHVSHQNGLDVDVYYPRRDGLERAPDALEDIDLALAQDLVDRFVAAGALLVFVGPRTGLTGPPAIVQPLARHDDHLHVRLPPG